jgi:hypothetical protein
MKKGIVKRLKEPSTWAGVGLLGTLFGVRELAAFGAPEIAVALAGLAAIFAPEGKPEATEDKPQ